MSISGIQVFDCEQGSPEWFACRLGIPTASEFDTVLAKGRDGKSESKTRRTYMMKLVGERITGEPMFSYSNEHMERGKEMEAEARDLYAFMKDVEPQRVGFIRNEIAGCSPDSLICDDGLLEVKTKLAHLQAEVLLCNEVPAEHMAQIQGQLWISGRQWCDFMSYWPKMPPFIMRVPRDEAHIARIASAVALFSKEVDTYHRLITGQMLRAA